MHSAVGGNEAGQDLYIGRASHCDSLTPGKIPENNLKCILPWGTIANIKEEFEVLVCPGGANWAAAQEGQAPVNAFPAGHSEDGETLFIGRVFHEGAVVVGKMQPSHRVCYIAYGGKELNFKQYEVLVV